MTDDDALRALAALSHRDRLAAFRLLAAALPGGLAAGALAAALGIGATAASFHLSGLVRAGLAQTRREGRHVVYRLRADGMRALMGYLTAECCHGRPELCGLLPAADTEGNDAWASSSAG